MSRQVQYSLIRRSFWRKATLKFCRLQRSPGRNISSASCVKKSTLPQLDSARIVRRRTPSNWRNHPWPRITPARTPITLSLVLWSPKNARRTSKPSRYVPNKRSDPRSLCGGRKAGQCRRSFYQAAISSLTSKKHVINQITSLLEKCFFRAVYKAINTTKVSEHMTKYVLDHAGFFALVATLLKFE